MKPDDQIENYTRNAYFALKTCNNQEHAYKQSLRAAKRE